MRIILIRHGQTYANELFNQEDQRILIGTLDTDITLLTEKGKRQAQKVCSLLEEVSIDEIYCSDLRRTIQTAQLIFPNRDIHLTSLLRERSLGRDAGKSAKDVFSNELNWKYHVNVEMDSLDECMHKKVDDGECYQDVFERCQEFLSQFDFSEDKTIAVVAHFHLIRCMIYSLLNKKADKELFELMIPNAYPLFFDYHKDHFDYQKDVICLVHPSIDYLDEINAFRLEMLEANDADGFAGCGGLEKYENIEEWMHQVKLRESEKTLPKGMVSSNVYLAIRIEDHHLVGIIDLRHHINHPILQKWGGHIGYSVRPSERRKGIAKEMLRLDLMQVKKLGIKRVLVTCSSTNAASRKVILANNGKFENSIEVNKDIIERYWIEVNHE